MLAKLYGKKLKIIHAKKLAKIARHSVKERLNVLVKVVKAVFNNVATVLAYVKIIKVLNHKIIFNLFRKKYLTNVKHML